MRSIKTVGIVSALNSEIKKIEKLVLNLEKIVIKNHIFFKGEIGNKIIIFIEAGVGKVNSAVTTQILIDNFNPDLIINTGIAGGLDSKLKHTDLVIADKLTYHDYEQRLLKKYSPNVEYFEVEEKLLEISRRILKNENYYEGLIVTGDQFVTDLETKNDIKNKFNALCIEMEGAAIAHTAYLNDIPFMVIRCISDLADNNGDEDYDEFEVIAAQKASDFTIKFINEI